VAGVGVVVAAAAAGWASGAGVVAAVPAAAAGGGGAAGAFWAMVVRWLIAVNLDIYLYVSNGLSGVRKVRKVLQRVITYCNSFCS
jgi:hypothetical protein